MGNGQFPRYLLMLFTRKTCWFSMAILVYWYWGQLLMKGMEDSHHCRPRFYWSPDPWPVPCWCIWPSWPPQRSLLTKPKTTWISQMSLAFARTEPRFFKGGNPDIHFDESHLYSDPWHILMPHDESSTYRNCFGHVGIWTWTRLLPL